MSSRKVRLPELPIFRKFSLALRQEFARAEDVLAALDESRRQIRGLTEEGGARLNPSLRSRPGREKRDPDATALHEGPQDEAPESFLKESIAGPGRRAPDGEDQAAQTSVRSKVTEVIPVKESAPGRPPRLPPRTRSSIRVTSGPGPGEDEEEPSAPEKPPRRPSASRSAGEKKPSARRPAKRQNTPPENRPEDEHPPEPLPQVRDEAVPPAPAASSGKAPPDEPPAPQAEQADDPLSEDEDVDFWGEERRGKAGRRGKAKSDKATSSRLAIVRVGSEGRPVRGRRDEGE